MDTPEIKKDKRTKSGKEFDTIFRISSNCSLTNISLHGANH
jgi:hypothetical protein